MIRRMIRSFHKIFEKNDYPKYYPELEYEYCPRCEANLTLQKGYDSAIPFWKCLGCGEMLINPAMETDSGIVWYCDGCQEILNVQTGFSESHGVWKCTECGYENKIDAEEVFRSEEEFQDELRNPYRGLKNEDLLELSFFEEIKCLGNHENVILVKHRENEKNYVKKKLVAYDVSIYRFLMKRQISHMPQIVGIYEGKNALIIIEEAIQGKTVEEILKTGTIDQERAVKIIFDLCMILNELHHLERPIIHRDIKPSNIIITPENEVWLLDVNVAKWHDPEEKDDTRHMGTWNYAAPEQVGYGMNASSPKTDIYAMGMLLNVMITGEFPKEKQADGLIWNIIERCISLNAEDRYTAKELADALVRLMTKGGD